MFRTCGFEVFFVCVRSYFCFLGVGFIYDKFEEVFYEGGFVVCDVDSVRWYGVC